MDSNWLCAAYQVVKNPSSTVTDTYPQLTIKGIGFVYSLYL